MFFTQEYSPSLALPATLYAPTGEVRCKELTGGLSSIWEGYVWLYLCEQTGFPYESALMGVPRFGGAIASVVIPLSTK